MGFTIYFDVLLFRNTVQYSRVQYTLFTMQKSTIHYSSAIFQLNYENKKAIEFSSLFMAVNRTICEDGNNNCVKVI